MRQTRARGLKRRCLLFDRVGQRCLFSLKLRKRLLAGTDLRRRISQCLALRREILFDLGGFGAKRRGAGPALRRLFLKFLDLRR